MMFRRSFLALMLITTLAGVASTSTARADDGGDGKGKSDGGSSNSGSGSGDSSGDSGSKDGGSEDGGSSGSGSEDGGSGSSGGESHDGAASNGHGSDGATSDQAGARRAVAERNAMPLKDVLQIFARQIGGEVVDASLIHGDAALRYRIKYIDGQGHVRRAYFDALTGQSL
jgi:hypothetical protein